MYIRIVSRKNKDDSSVRYVQLAHNYRDKKSGNPQAKVLYNFGREEEVDKDALRRLVKSINRFLGPEDVLQAQAGGSADSLSFISSKSLGGAWFLDRLWQKLGVKSVLEKLLHNRNFSVPVERAIFAMVAKPGN